MTKRKRLSVDGKDDPSKTSIDVSTKKSNVHGSGKKKAGLTESNKKQKQESHFITGSRMGKMSKHIPSECDKTR